MYDFKWINWNLEKIDKHNISRQDAEFVVNHPFRGYPRHVAGKRVARGQSTAGKYIQVAYVIEPDDRVFVIHARPLAENEKRQLRRRSR